MGLWRPEAGVRAPEAAIQALEPKLIEILRSAPDTVQVSLLKAVERLGMTNAAPLLTQVLTNSGAADVVRAAALSALAGLNSPLLEQAMDHARNDSSELVRNRATRLEGKLASSDPVTRLARILDRGSVSEQQTAFATLAGIPGSAADILLMQWLERLEKDRVPNEVRLDLLEAARKRSSSQLHARLEQYEASRSQADPLAVYQECLSGGAAAEGRKIFLEKEETQCIRCHKVDAQGGDVGPNLTHVGAQKDRRYLLESIVLPNKQIAPGFDSITVTLKDGDSYAGVLKSETATDLILNTPDQGLVTIKKADIDTRRAALSPMPEGLGQILSKEELRSLVEFLSSLK
jgi:quinoprotein glucose dehydrogenase